MTPQPRRLWQLPIFVLGLASVWAAATYVTPPPSAHARSASKLEDLSVALERSPAESRDIEPLVRMLADAPDASPRSHYLLGSAYVVLARVKPTDSPDLWKLAGQHFDACDGAALKPEEAAKLVFRSAQAKAAVGSGDPKALIAALMTVPANEDKTECPRLIADCALRMNDPKRARDELTLYLGSANKASPAMADWYKLKLAELCRAAGDTDRARRWLTDISAAAPTDILAEAKIALAQDAMIAKNWTEAVRLYESALALPNLPPATKGNVRYALGDAHLRMNATALALPCFEQASREPGMVGGQASLRIAEIRAFDPMGRGKRNEAIEWLERAAEAIPREKLTDWEPQSALQILEACKVEGEYASALRAAAAYGIFTTEANARLEAARIERTWGETLLKAGDTAAAKAKFLSAGKGLQESAMQNVKQLREAATMFRKAGADEQAMAVLTPLLKDPAVDKATLAAISLERAELLPATETQAIASALETAMSQPGPQALRAKLKLALMNVQQGVSTSNKEMGEFGRSLLRQVAELAIVPAESQGTHEQALFERGRLSLKDGQYTDAEARFKKQITLYPNGTYAGYGRLWLVCSLLQQARQPDASKKLLEDALTHLAPLTESTDPYLRTYGEIWTANTHLELGNITDALTRSKALMAKYQGKPEELVAGKLLFYAYLKLPSPEAAEAGRTLERMETAFAGLPKESYPNDPEYSHERWKSQLPVLRDELRKFTK